MPVPTHFKFTFRGTFKTTEEIWTTGVKFERNQQEGPDAGLSDINESAVTTAATVFFSSTRFNDGIDLTDWRAYVIGTDGKMEGNGPLIHTFATPISGGSSSVRFPSEIALCVTTVADNRGPAKLGRFYLPGINAVLSSDWRLATTVCQSFITDTTTFLKGISDAIDIPGSLESSDMVNVSDRGNNGAGTIQSVDHIEIGRVLDVVQRRRNKLLEERVVGAQIDW